MGHILFYLPQRPYLFHGTLKEQVLYPYSSGVDREISDEDLTELLKLVGISSIRKHMKTISTNWCDILSPGEQQLLSFVRLLYHKPTIAILDEATSSLTEQMERKLYSICQERNITTLSVGHRMSLTKYHHKILKIGDHGDWLFSQIHQSQEPQNMDF
jgi:ABC-type uncharacterized transport system fused permease/ATPase subunit